VDEGLGDWFHRADWPLYIWHDPVGVSDDGRKYIDEVFMFAVKNWRAPELETGDTIDLEEYVCPLVVPDESLPHFSAVLCNAPNQVLQLETSPFWDSAGVRAKMNAASGGVLVDGGEAIGCFGKDSTIANFGNFGTSCNSGGISLSVNVTETDRVTYRVKHKGQGVWEVIEPDAMLIPTLQPGAYVWFYVLVLLLAWMQFKRHLRS